MIVLLIIPLLLLIGSIYLIRSGRRGAVIDNHPLCAACGFDLTGKPETSAVCAECGHDVSAPAGIVIGHRAIRCGRVMAGVTGLVLSLAIMLSGGLRLMRNMDRESFKPTWYVFREAESGEYTQAMSELLKRETAGQLNAAQTDRFIKRILTIQKSPVMLWDVRYGAYIEQLHFTDKLGEDNWKTYARQGVIPEFVITTEASPGDPVQVSLYFRRRISSRTDLLFFREDVAKSSVSIDGAQLIKQDLIADGAIDDMKVPLPNLDDAVRRLGNGNHSIRLQKTLSIIEGTGTTQVQPPIADVAIDLKAEFHVHERNHGIAPVAK